MSNEHIFNKADKEAVDIVVVIAENGNCNEPKGIFIPADDSFEVISSLNAPRRRSREIYHNRLESTEKTFSLLWTW